MIKNTKHNQIKKIIILFFILCSIVIFPNSVFATEQSELEDKIENTINSVLQNYINNINLDKEVETAVNEAIEKFFNNLDKESLEKDIKDNVKSALQSNLYDIQTKFEEVIVEKTYEVTNNLLNEKVRQEIGNEIRNMVKSHNDSCYYEDEETGRRYLKPGAKLISDSEVNNMVNNVVKYVNSYTTIGEQISSTVKNDTTEFIYLADFITDYLFTSDEKLEAANSNGGNLTKVDRLKDYITADKVISDLRSKLNIDITNEIKDVLKESVNTYLSSCSGESIFNDIKTGIYYYIKENGSFEEVEKNGFSDKAIEYITGQITKIVSSNIEYQVAPYVANVAEGLLDEIIFTMSSDYINNGVGNLIKNSVPYGVEERFKNSLSDLMYDNVVKYTDAYLKSLKNNSNLRGLINREFAPYTSSDYGYTVLYNVGIKWHYTYDENGNVESRTEVDTETMTYTKNTIFPEIKNYIKNAMVEYINGNKGIEILELARSNIEDVLTDSILKPLVIEINSAVSNWIINGIVEDIWNAIREQVYQYLKNIENDMDSFQQETGIILGDILKEIRVEEGPLYDKQISFEDLANSPFLISSERGKIIVPRQNKYDRLNDATLEIGVISIYEEPTYDSSKRIIYDATNSANELTNPFAKNPYGATINTYYGSFGIPGIAGISRTLAEYSSRGIKNLEPEEAYVLSHQKDTTYYPDAVQMAYWHIEKDIRGVDTSVDEGIVDRNTYNIVTTLLRIASSINNAYQSFVHSLETSEAAALLKAQNIILDNKWDNINHITQIMNMVSNVSEVLKDPYKIFENLIKDFLPGEKEKIEGKDSEDPVAGIELYTEATALGKALDNWNAFEEENGANLVDRTDYSKVEVSYSKDTDKILVGPFTIDYIREFFVPISDTDSEMYDKDTGIISFTGIIDAKLYADDEKTIEIKDWQFVYPDKRSIVTDYDKQYKFPYPNEVFYLEFPSMENYSINTLSKMRFQLEKMDADGQTYELKGGYDQLLWMGVDIPLVCPLPALACVHGVIGGHATSPVSWCPLLCCPIHKTPTGTPPLHFAWNGHLFGHQYFCQQVPLGTNLHAMNLEQIIYSKIYKEYKYIDIELGEVKPYYVTSVNTTQNMQESVNKGNLLERTESVPILPFLPNYDTYPGYPNYPQYPGSPNYPDVPYSFNSDIYPDYASYPYYTGKGPNGASDPTYPYYPENRVIPLTFHISGTVWLDNPGGTEAEANGVIDENERGIPNVEVILYKKGDKDYIAKTLTNEEGYYIFEYVRVGFDYYVEFAYDGMTYKTTEYLQSDIRENNNNQNIQTQTEKYKKNPENYLTSSHALENVAERDAFNDKFYNISENLATAKDGSTIDLEYKTWETSNGSVSILITTDDREITKDEFKMYARTMETSLYLPVDNQYQVDFADLDLYKDGTTKYIKTYPCLEHINLGLIQREQGDFGTKSDVYQVITTEKLDSETGNDIQKYKYDDKNVNDDHYDILNRNTGYYTDIPYNQELNPDDVAYRYDSEEIYGDNAELVSTILTEKSEQNVYIEYKLLIKNRGTLESGRLLEIEDSFDADLEYSSKYDFTDLASWIEVPMNEEGKVTKEEILWEYRAGTENGYSTIYTDDLKDKSLAPGETIEIHLILKVKKDENRTLKMDLAPNEFKENITEVTIYAYDEGLIDKTSNPGSARLGNPRTYADGTDTAPLLKLIYEQDYSLENSNTIQGYVWEDIVTDLLKDNNQLISNGIIDDGEVKINDVKVELIEVLRDPKTGAEIEVLRKTPSGTDYYRTGEDIVVDGQTIDIQDGEYKFFKLENGTFRVKFTYGDEYQLVKDLTFNAQDYKTLSLDTIYQQYNNPSLEVMIMLDTSENMKTDNKGNLMRTAITPLVDSLYKNVQKVKIGGYMFSEPAGTVERKVGFVEKPNAGSVIDLFKDEAINAGRTLSESIEDALNQFSRNADGKVILILTDGYMKETEKDKEALLKAKERGVQVITIACSMDEWDDKAFGTEEAPTAGILYNIKHGNCEQYVSKVALEDILLEFEKVLPNLTDAKDVEYSYKYYVDGKEYEDIYSRKHNIDYSSVITNENAEVLHIENILSLQRELEAENSKEEKDTDKINNLQTEISNRILELAKNTKVTAITPNRNITFLHNNSKTQNTNMGLIERPKVEFKVDEEVSNIRITLANGEVIIDTSKGLNQNVQEIVNDRFNIFMDEEIMQGATIEIQYKITVTNNGEVDTLADYFTYDMFNPEETYYATTTVANKIGTIYDYYTNTVFRAEDNNNINVEVNDVDLKGLRFDGITIKNWQELFDEKRKERVTPEIRKITTRLNENDMPVLLNETVVWQSKNSIKLNENVENYIDNDEIKIIETKSLKDTPIYPNISKEAISNTGVSSISFYVNYSKQLSANDDTDTLLYKNSTEIVERLNAVGRRDYIAVTGNYKPHDENSQEYDSVYSEDVVILPPFGQDMNYVLYIIIALGATLIVVAGVLFIKRKVL